MAVFHFYELLQLWGDNLLQVKLHDPNLKIKADKSFYDHTLTYQNISKAPLAIG